MTFKKLYNTCKKLDRLGFSTPGCECDDCEGIRQEYNRLLKALGPWKEEWIRRNE